MEDKHNMSGGTKNSLYFPETKFKTTHYFQPHNKLKKNIYISLLFVVRRKAIFIFIESKFSHNFTHFTLE
jgi:hypothetical protein